MRFRETLRIAVCDMIARRSSAATLAIIVTITVLTAVTIGAYGLVLGQQKVSYRRIQTDPLLGCLWVGEPTLTKRRIDWARIEQLDNQIRSRIRDQSGYVGCFPFRLMDVQIYSVQGGGKLISCSGRTYFDSNSEKPSDQILESLGVQNLTPGQPGIILTPMLLKKLAWESASVGDQIDLRVGGTVVPLNIAGIAKQDLPYGLEFLIPESLDDSQIRRPRAQYATEVISGQAPPEWTQPLEDMLAGKSKSELAETWNLLQKEEVSALYDDQTRQLILNTNDRNGRNADYWGYALELIAKQLPVVTDQAKLNFIKLKMTVSVTTSEQADVEKLYDMAGFYFSNLSYLPLAEEVVQLDDVLKGFVDASVIKQLAAADGQTKTALQIVTTFELMIGTMALTNLLVIQWFRAAWQRREAGMLRACGMQPQQLMLIGLSQGTIVWLAGSSLGLAMGWTFGRWMTVLQYHDPAEIKLGFYVPQWLWLSSCISVWLLCCSTNLLCSLRSFIVEPAQLVDDL